MYFCSYFAHLLSDWVIICIRDFHITLLYVSSVSIGTGKAVHFFWA